MTKVIEITGDTTELVVDSIKRAMIIDDEEEEESKQQPTQIRLFNFDIARLNDEQVTMLEDVLNSRSSSSSDADGGGGGGWERVVVSLIRGDVSESFAQALILNTKSLEVYGNTMNLLDVYASNIMSSRKQLTCCGIEAMKLRTRFNCTSVTPLSDILLSTNTSFPSLKVLNLTCEFADRESMIAMAKALNKNKSLEKLTMYSCEFFDESTTESLIRSLIHHPTLSTLALRDNNHLAMAAVTDLVSRTCGLKTLRLYYPPSEVNTGEVQIPRINVDSLSIAVKKNTSLKSLDLSSNGLDDGSAMCLALALRFNTTLSSLNLQGNIISDQGAIAIGKALPEMQGLKELYLWNNKFCGVGARALLAGLKVNKVLETLTTFSGFKVAKEMQYYTHLNKAGRSQNILGDHNSLSMNIWPFVLERVNQQKYGDDLKCSVIYTLLREGPVAITS